MSFEHAQVKTHRTRDRGICPLHAVPAVTWSTPKADCPHAAGGKPCRRPQLLLVIWVPPVSVSRPATGAGTVTAQRSLSPMLAKVWGSGVGGRVFHARP
jgi:hypothetical protein